MARSASYTVIFMFLLFIIAAVAIMVGKGIDSVSVDFGGYYNDAGQGNTSDTVSKSVFADVGTDMSHAASSHPEDMGTYKKCMEDGNPIMAFEDPATKHCIEILETEVEEAGKSTKQWVVRVVKQVDGKWQEITAFCDSWACVDDIEMYLNQGGYMKIWP
jgi:hypothetical protein